MQPRVGTIYLFDDLLGWIELDSKTNLKTFVASLVHMSTYDKPAPVKTEGLLSLAFLAVTDRGAATLADLLQDEKLLGPVLRSLIGAEVDTPVMKAGIQAVVSKSDPDSKNSTEDVKGDHTDESQLHLNTTDPNVINADNVKNTEESEQGTQSVSQADRENGLVMVCRLLETGSQYLSEAQRRLFALVVAQSTPIKGPDDERQHKERLKDHKTAVSHTDE